jgi:hypothetical protein
MNDEDVTLEVKVTSHQEDGYIRYVHLVREKREREARTTSRKVDRTTYDIPKMRFMSYRDHASKKHKRLRIHLDEHSSYDDMMFFPDEELSPTLCTALSCMTQNPANHTFRYVSWRTRGDLKPHGSKVWQTKVKKGTSTKWVTVGHDLSGYPIIKQVTINRSRKKPYKAKSRSLQKNINAFAKNEISKRADDFSLDERLVMNEKILRMAGEFILRREGKADYFHHPDGRIDQVVQIVLKYVQSRIDRGLTCDMKEIVWSHDSVLNARLAKWEGENAKKIISIPDVFAGRFYRASPDGFRYSFIPIDTKVQVSEGYSAQPDRYVTTRKEFLSAVKRVLSGEVCNVSYFNRLDPVTTMTLEWCVLMREKGYTPRPQDVVGFKNPELCSMLRSNGLYADTDKPFGYSFFFNNGLYKWACEVGIRHQMEKAESAARLPREESIQPFLSD